MFEAITAFLIVLSVGILIAHALDALRPWAPSWHWDVPKDWQLIGAGRRLGIR